MQTWLLILPGAVVVIAGLLFILFPPVKINKLYGYRTPRSMRNKDTWDVANRFASWLIVFAGLIGINAGLTCNYLLSAPANMITTVVALLIALACVIVLTERRLADLFDENGQWRTEDPEP